MASPPPSPLRVPLTVTVSNAITKLRRRAPRKDIVECVSGSPLTHPSLSGDFPRRIRLGHADRYACLGGVDVVKLLRGSRASLLEKAGLLGANVLVEESWICRIRIPKNRRDGKFRVQIRYYASASRSSVPDPQKPVALDKVKNVPGLMTIVGRDEVVP